MNRRVWVAVAATTAALVALSLAFSPPKAPNAILAVLGSGFRRLDGLLELLSWEVVGGIAVLGLSGMLLLVRRGRTHRGSGEPWRTVIELGRQGRSPSAIARTARVPQDAVRIVLSPIAQDRPVVQGKSFRPSSPPQSDATGSTRHPRPGTER